MVLSNRTIAWMCGLGLVVLAGPPVIADQMGPVKSGVKPTHERSMKRGRVACTGGDGDACDRLGSVYADSFFSSDGDEHDGDNARALFQKACDLGSTMGCTDLGWAFLEGIAGRDNLRALELFTRTCDAGDPRGCSYLASMYEHHHETKGVKADPQRARALYERVCSGKIDGLGCLAGCDTLAMWNYYGDRELAIPSDHAKAAAFEDRACAAGCINSCDKMGDHYRDGDGVAQDPKTAATRYQTGCDAGFGPSCKELGKLYLAGAGVTASMTKARRSFDRACRVSRGQVEECQSDATGGALRKTITACNRKTPPTGDDARLCDDLYAFRKNGSIGGTVTIGGKPASAWIGTEGEPTFGVVADVQGMFSIPNVPAGSYVLRTDDASSSQRVRIPVTVTVGQRTTLTIDVPVSSSRGATARPAP
ncbi:MAG: hypothetical protein ABI591_04080 [Kofleriaceae bacterium]